MKHRRFSLVPLVFLLVTFLSPAEASAQCGGYRQLPCYPWICDVWIGDFCLVSHPDLSHPSCNAGLEPILGLCQQCGGAGQFVCPSRGCDAGLVNVLGFCQECGADWQPACPTGCDTRYNNILGVCVHCGADGEFACDLGNRCDAGHTEILSHCYLCGEAGQFTCATEPHCANNRLNETLGFCIECGGNVQPLCVSGAPCDDGFTAVAGLCLPGECGGAYQVTCAEPAPLCDSDRFNAIPPIATAGVCIPCGTDGLPVCLQGRPCERFNAEAGIGALAVCVGFSPAVEPNTGATVPVAPPATFPDGELFGFADIHNHMFANLGFGGLMVWGAPFDPDGITYALPWCDYTREFDAVNLLGLPVLPVPTLGIPVHGPLHANDIMGSVLGELLWDVQGGSSQRVWESMVEEDRYNAWPSWKSVDHQLMYHKWVERAYQGGQRLMVMLAVNNVVICDKINRRVINHPDGGRQLFDCSDWDAFRHQILAAKAMEEYIDNLNGGNGWFKIAYSAHQAREIINSGKMAVILGLEAATIFDSAGNDGRTPDLDAELTYWYNLGVRWVFPIHLWDNDFGGAAINQAIAYAGNFISAGYVFETYECGTNHGDYGFSLGYKDAIADFFRSWFGLGPETLNFADCNQRGLSPVGVLLMQKLMEKKMIIDIDHFSKVGLNQALDIAEEAGYPLVASHTRFYDVTFGQERSESAKTLLQVARLRNLGGIVAPILAPVAGVKIGGYGQTVPNDCAGSSKQWAQQYLYAIEKMARPNQPAAVAFGSDFNAPIGHIAPRFGNDGCMGEDPGVHHQPQTNGIVYPFEAFGVPGSQFSKQQTGSRQFDFNVDGLAHAGLLPDMIQDMRNTGITDAQLGPLFHSAEAVVRMWERIEGRGTPPPSATYAISPLPNANGWNNSPVTVTLAGTPAGGGTPIRQIRYSVGGAAPILISGPSATLTLGTEGVTGITFTVEDTAGHVTAPQTLQVMIDMTRPTAFAERSEPANERGWNRSAVTISFTGTDDRSGLEGCSAPVTLSGEGTGQQAGGTCTDRAGNVSEAVVETVNIDVTPPTVHSQRTPAANGSGWNNTPVTVAFDGDDALSGIFRCSGGVVLSNDGENQVASGSCEDKAGNVSAAAAIGGINIDRTPPVLNGSRTVANEQGWNNSTVTVEFACSDALSGVGVAPTTPQLVTAEGTGQSRTATCTDRAGNTASATVENINIDLTPPVASAQAAPSPNAAGWYNSAVTVSFSGTDALSGMDGCTANVVLTQEGAGQSASGVCVDRAGNSASATVAGINIDLTPPVMVCSATPDVIWPPNHLMVPVTNLVRVTDPLSSAASFRLLFTASNEPDDRVADDALGKDTLVDIQGFVLGTSDTEGAVRAERNGSGRGRQYTFRYEGFDRAGNRAECAIIVSVPHDMY